MSGLILATEQAVGSHFFRSSTFSKPTALWIGLFTTMPANAGTGGVEVSGGNYLRIQSDPSNLNWGMDGSEFYNLFDIVFPFPTATWGMVVGVGLWSAPTGGTLYMVAPLTSRTPWEGLGRDPFMGVYVAAGETSVKFDVGQLRLSVY